MEEERRKNGIFITTKLIAVALLLLVAVIASSAEGPAVMITDYTVEPAVFMPGDTGTITLTIKNPFIDTQSSETEMTVGPSGTTQQTSTTTSSRGVIADIETIRLVSGSSKIEWLKEGTQRSEYKNVGAIGPGESITVSIPIQVAAYAQDGTYFPEVYIEVKEGENVRFPLSVKVDSSEVVLLEKDIPSDIYNLKYVEDVLRKQIV